MTGFSPQVVRKMIAVYDGPEDPRTLLRSVGLPPADVADETGEALRPTVSAEALYALFERPMADDDGTLPLRYARAITPDDFGALGLAVKTAATPRGALERIARYLLLLTDTATYSLAARLPSGEDRVPDGLLRAERVPPRLQALDPSDARRVPARRPERPAGAPGLTVPVNRLAVAVKTGSVSPRYPS